MQNRVQKVNMFTSCLCCDAVATAVVDAVVVVVVVANRFFVRFWRIVVRRFPFGWMNEHRSARKGPFFATSINYRKYFSIYFNALSTYIYLMCCCCHFSLLLLPPLLSFTWCPGPNYCPNVRRAHSQWENFWLDRSSKWKRGHKCLDGFARGGHQCTYSFRFHSTLECAVKNDRRYEFSNGCRFAILPFSNSKLFRTALHICARR